MTQNYRISGLAIASLVFGMLFFIPLIGSVLALVLGIKAYFSIRNSDGYVLGKNIAISGIFLGGIQLFLWCMVLFSGFFYIVEQNEQAVVTYSGKVVREEYPGFHTKIPFMEKVYFYPKDKMFKLDIEPTQFILNTRQPVMIAIGLRYRVCKPEAVFNAFHGNFDQASIHAVITQIVLDRFRSEVSKYNNVSELYNSVDKYKALYTDKHEKIYDESSSYLRDKYGICLVSYDAKDYFNLSTPGFP